ncbi:c-type cytochrome [Paraglaciecola hydrolytica]|uniref:Cytochrome C n=1 Tax=Paraglaciecola hydrolytica TaxID=1799789 RepID=A0A148KMY6_9ALTE|nr:cytochrome c [Paraglaciecola hydrolytica]KXI27672.1 hypothetical protein AX660_19150 [Paraglaciecola hydrolytica]
MTLKKNILSIAIMANIVGVTFMTAASPAQAVDTASIIESRQGKLKKMGGAMKAINEQLKADQADVTKIQEAAQTLSMNAAVLADWFPAGSGAESGIKTDALAAIWQDPDKFSTKAKGLIAQTTTLVELASQADIDSLPSQLKAVKDACSDCHKNFRAD